MPLELALLKLRLGIAPDDETQDAVITMTALQAQSLCEDKCDRKFDLAADEETFFGRGCMMLLRRWPIARDKPIVISGPSGEPVEPAHFAVDYDKGMIASPDYWWRGCVISYWGGWDIWPPSLSW